MQRIRAPGTMPESRAPVSCTGFPYTLVSSTLFKKGDWEWGSKSLTKFDFFFPASL